MAEDLDFACTECGACCHGLKLPLTVTEAIGWLARGHQVQVLCEAVPWPADMPPTDLQAQHKRRRSFEAISGVLPTRVVAILAASFSDACPNLGADNRCSIYERRPLVCRIYPAEISPFMTLSPESKACPPQAWASDRPALMRGGMLVNAEVRELIRRSRGADEAEVKLKARLCSLLGFDRAALANEGFVVYSPESPQLMDALTTALTREFSPAEQCWSFVSNQRATLDALTEAGAASVRADSSLNEASDYLGYRIATV
jgi:Fe-S-cluster containining protein